MNLYSYKTTKDCPFQTIIVKDNIITLSITLNNQRDAYIKTKIIDISKLDKNKIYTLNYLIDGYYQFLIDDEHEPISEYAALRIYISNNNAVELYSPINIYISETSEQINRIYLDNFGKFNFRAEISNKYLEYQEKSKKTAYHDMLHDLIDANYSCTCQDAQIEILTKIILNILKNNPKIITEDCLSNLDTVINSLNDTSLFNIKNEESIIKEIENKKYIRNLQKEYYSLKSNMED